MDIIEEQIFNMPETVIKSLISIIETPLKNAGLYVRVFGRVKNYLSLKKKYEVKKYNSQKKLQDLFGVRITAYFKDDVKICKDIMTKIFQVDNISEDHKEASTFKPERLNIVCKLPETIKKDLDDVLFNSYIDDTFEIQIRTVFSEGWHEVEHDLRYKCNGEWDDEIETSRTLNGIYATLITCDWAIIKLFDDRAYHKYRHENWSSMLRNKFRIKFIDTKIDDEFLENKKFMKEVFKINRGKIVSNLTSLDFPLTMNNFLHIANVLYVMDNNINTPTMIKKAIMRNNIKP